MQAFSSVLMGDQSLIVQCGDVLRENGHPIVAVVTTADPVASWARAGGIPVIRPSTTLMRELVPYSYDWFFSIGNLRRVAGEVYRRARKGSANFHDGPLPRFAGLNAPAWAILAGETNYGVAWHELSERVDAGAIYCTRPIEISDDDSALTLNTKCFEAGIASFAELVGQIQSDSIRAEPQDLSNRSYYAKNARPKAAATIDFGATTAEIYRLARAMDFGRGYDNPLCLPKVATKHGIYPITELALAETGMVAPAGTVVSVTELGAIVATSDGNIVIKMLCDSSGELIQPASVLDAGDLLPRLDAAEMYRRTELALELAKNESYFSARLRKAQSPDLDGLLPPSAIRAQWDTVEVALPKGSTGDGTVAALACFFARTGNQSRYRIAYVDDELSELASKFRGLVAPTVPLTLETVRTTTVDELLEGVKSEFAGLRSRPGYPADLVYRSADLRPVQATVAICRTNRTAAAEGVAGSAVTFVVPPKGSVLRVVFDASRISRGSIERMLRQVRVLMSALEAGAGTTRVADLPILTPAEIHAVAVEANRTERNYDRKTLIHRLIEEQARRTPDATALVDASETLTYSELDSRANRVAQTLVARGVGPDSRVGLYIGRCCDLVVGALAILKAGGAYVPLDPSYPNDRTALVVKDSGMGLVLTKAGAEPPITCEAASIITIEDAISVAAASPALRGSVEARNLAYVIYTSGSTGQPKGVMVEHGNVLNFFAGMDERIPRPESGQPVWLAVTSLSFDISVLELFWTLSRGFAVVIHDGPLRSQQREMGSPKNQKAIDFSLFFWGNDEGVGPHKYQLLLDGARYADAHGFCAVWTPERHFHAFGGPYPNPSVTGAAVAAVTRNLAIRAGSCVLPLHHPARVAEEWAVVDNISNGRAGMAFASGWMPDDFLLRPENAPPNNKASLLRDIDIVRRLWRGESVTFDGPRGKQIPVVTQPRPVSKELSVWVTTAGNPETYRDAARLGANVLTHLLGQSIAEVAEKIRIYREVLAETGRNPADYCVTLMLHTLIGPDREHVREMARGPMKAYLASAAALLKQYAWAFPTFKRPVDSTSFDDVNLQALPADEFDAIVEFAFLRYFEDSGLFGSVDDALSRVDQLQAIGVNEIACLVDFGIPTAEALRALEPLGQVVRASRNGHVTMSQTGAAGATAEAIQRHGVTHLQCTPSMAAMLLINDEDRAALRTIRHLFIGGEALHPALVDELTKATEASIENMYGPTETTIWSSTGPARRDGEMVPLGTPIANTQLYILDSSQRLVPDGSPGELYIGGDGVARGYLGRDDLTRERFLHNSFSGHGRMYRTGDLVRRGENGAIYFLGRTDYQVKVRGYRIELGEIESCVECHPAVAEAVVMAREDTVGDVRIVAYVRYHLNEHVSGTELKDYAARSLPDFMVPAHFVSMQSFPLTPNGKVDRKALPCPEDKVNPSAAAAFVAPSNDLQKGIAAAFRRVLGLERVSISDNFFSLGGHSLLAVRLHRDLKAELVPNLTITDVYRFPTVAGLAEHLQHRDRAGEHLKKVADRAARRRQGHLGRRTHAREVS